MKTYSQFLDGKVLKANSCGFDVKPESLNVLFALCFLLVLAVGETIVNSLRRKG